MPFFTTWLFMGYWIQGRKNVALPFVPLGYLSDAGRVRHLNPLRLLGKLESMKEKQNTNINATRFIGMEPNSGVSASPFDIVRICLSKLLCLRYQGKWSSISSFLVMKH